MLPELTSYMGQPGNRALSEVAVQPSRSTATRRRSDLQLRFMAFLCTAAVCRGCQLVAVICKIAKSCMLTHTVCAVLVPSQC